MNSYLFKKSILAGCLSFFLMLPTVNAATTTHHKAVTHHTVKHVVRAKKNAAPTATPAATVAPATQTAASPTAVTTAAVPASVPTPLAVSGGNMTAAPAVPAAANVSSNITTIAGSNANVASTNTSAPSVGITTASAPIGVGAAAPTPGAPPKLIPAAPDFDAAAYVLIDANSGYVIAEKNADGRLPPASLTKLMTLYLTANALKAGQIHFEDQVTISENAWRVGGSRMFIRVGSTVPVKELVDGIVVASGNDATVAMAEYLGGTEGNFATMMNQMAGKLGMQNTHYTDSNGLPAPDHYSSARDLSTLARAWINTFPEYYPWFKQQWIMYNNIKQPNRNRLLWQDKTVDGMKTGHTDAAGFCLVASAVRNGTRLIAVVLGAKGDQARTNYTEALLNYGFRFYETHKLFAANTALHTQRIWFGEKKTLALGVKDDFYATIPSGEFHNLKADIVVNDNVRAPITKGQALGTVNVSFNGKVVASQPLVALDDDPKANFIMRFFDYLALLMHRIF